MKIKKIISFGLFAILLSNVITPAFALNDTIALTDNSENINPDKVMVYMTTDGLWNQSNRSTRTTLTATKTTCEEIYELPNEQLIMSLGDGLYQPVEQLEVNTDNIQSNMDVFEGYDISGEIIEGIEDVLNEQSDNSDLEVYIYTPATEQVSTRASVYPTKDSLVEFRNMHPTNWVDLARGTNAAQAAGEISTLILGFAGKVGAVFSFGLSLLSIYENATGKYVEYGTTADYLGVWHVYDKIEKYTSVNTGNNNWVVACKSYKVWINYVKLHMFFSKAGYDRITQHSINKVQYSNHWNDAAAVARNNVFNQMVIDQPIQLTIGRTTLIL